MQNLHLLSALHADRRWKVTAILTVLLSLGILLVPSAHAAAPSAPIAQENIDTDIITNGDLTVESGQIVNGDVVVFSGNVLMEDEALVNGDLVAMSGNLEIEEGARVTGDVVLFSGNAVIDGEIGGDLALWSGNIDLGDDAQIDGDVSLLSGELDSDGDAVIGGSITYGPDFDLQMPFFNSILGAMPAAPANPDSPAAADAASEDERVVQVQFSPDEHTDRVGFGGWLGSSILRFLRAAFYVGLLTLGATALTSARPNYVHRVGETIQRRTAAAFALGLIVTLVLGVFFFLSRLSACLWPIALLPTLVLLGLNVAGWAAIGREIGARLNEAGGLSLDETPATALGVTAGAGLIGAVGALGLCFTPISWLLLAVASSLGAGAVLLPWAQRLLDGSGNTTHTTSVNSGSLLAVSERAEEETAAQSNSSAPAEATSSDVEPSGLASAETLGTAPKEVQAVESDEDADLDYAATVSNEARAADRTSDDGTEGDSTEDDLTRINGIGRTFDSRLKEAGIRTFVQLANTDADTISKIIGWSVERVMRDDLIGQARILASGGEV